MIFKFLTFYFTTRRPRSFEVLYPQSRNAFPWKRCTDAACQALAVSCQGLENSACVAAVLIFSNREWWGDQPVISKYFCTAEGFHPFPHFFHIYCVFVVIFLSSTSSLPHSDAFFDSSTFPAMPTNAFIFFLSLSLFSLFFLSRHRGLQAAARLKLQSQGKNTVRAPFFSHRKSNRNLTTNHNRSEILLETCSNLMQGKQQIRCIPSVLNEIPRFPSSTPQLSVLQFPVPTFQNPTVCTMSLGLQMTLLWSQPVTGLGEKNIRNKFFSLKRLNLLWGRKAVWYSLLCAVFYILQLYHHRK